MIMNRRSASGHFACRIEAPLIPRNGDIMRIHLGCELSFAGGKLRIGVLEIAEFLRSFGERGVLVSNALNSAALARYCSI
jgi:hypothetical protein